MDQAHPATYDPRRHAAAHTSDYVYSQLIPYLGNKRKLLPLIGQALAMTAEHKGTFVDLFAGSTAVARFAKALGFRVLANDWEPYSHQIAHGTVALNEPPSFPGLGTPAEVFAHLDALPPLHGYISQHYCPQDDEHPDPARERMFFTRQNGERIDAIREQLHRWHQEGRLSADALAYVLSSLLFATSHAANTSGIFKAFHHGWGGSTGAALHRIRARLRLVPPVLLDNGQPNLALQEDAQTLAKDLRQVLDGTPAVVYLDPPYNQHPYASNYHLLNTIALWDKPPLSPSVLVDGKVRDRAAIRRDWKERRSPYNCPRTALPAFADLVGSLEARWLLVSYSTDGSMPLRGLLAVLAARGGLRVVTRQYERYRVSRQRPSHRPTTTEFVAVVDTHARSSLSRVDEVAEAILRQDARSLAA
jgi:adenine-specific DNA-methyltransferase